MTTSDAQRRRLILEAAERLLRHYGPSKTTIAEIAREAAVGVGTVYLEFDSKDAIIEELSVLQHAAVLRAMREAAERAGEYAARLAAVFDARVLGFLQLADGGAHAPELVHCTRPGVKSANARFHAEEHALLAGLLRDATRAREFDVAEPDLAATVVVRAYASFAPPWIYAMPREEVHGAVRAMHELVLRGLLRRGNGRGPGGR